MSNVLARTRTSPEVFPTSLLSFALPLAAMAGLNLALVVVYLGWAAAVGYGCGFLALVLGAWFVPFSARAARRWVWVCVAGAALLQVVALHLLAPAFEARMDRNEALTYWLDALWKGQFPYAVPTNIGNPISVLPALPLLAAPFVALGNVGYLEVGAFLLLAVLLHRWYNGAPRAQLTAILVLASAPLVFFEVIARSDLIANCALLMLLVVLVERREQALAPLGARASLLLGLLFGCLVATRFALLPVFVTVALYLLRRLRLAELGHFAVSALLACAALIAPFLLWDSTTFLTYAPFGVNSTKLGADIRVSLFWLALTAAATLVGGLKSAGARTLPRAIVGVVTVIVLATWLTFFLDLSYMQLIFVPLLFTLPKDVRSGAPAPAVP